MSKVGLIHVVKRRSLESWDIWWERGWWGLSWSVGCEKYLL